MVILVPLTFDSMEFDLDTFKTSGSVILKADGKGFLTIYGFVIIGVDVMLRQVRENMRKRKIVLRYRNKYRFRC